MNGDFKYELFLSYGSPDLAWAEVLFSRLEARLGAGKVYFDKERIQAGKQWPTELRSSLHNSRHMVILSSNVKGAWREGELSYFDGIRLSDASRRLIPVIFEDGNMSIMFNETQQIDARELYKKTSQQVSQAEWADLVGKIVQGLDGTTVGTPLNVLVLTGTRQEVDASFSQRVGSESLEDILQQGMHRIDRNELLAHYGDTREDWRPFSGNERIGMVLKGLESRINQCIQLAAGKQSTDLFYSLTEGSAAFWGDNEELIQAEANKLQSGPAVVIIDPIALMIPEVRERWNYCTNVVNNREAVVMTFSPFSSECFSWTRIVRRNAGEFYNSYYQPDLHRLKSLAQLCIHTIHLEDASRVMRHSIGSRLHAGSQTPYLTMKGNA
jgi:hypothetical protein